MSTKKSNSLNKKSDKNCVKVFDDKVTVVTTQFCPNADFETLERVYKADVAHYKKLLSQIENFDNDEVLEFKPNIIKAYRDLLQRYEMLSEELLHLRNTTEIIVEERDEILKDYLKELGAVPAPLQEVAQTGKVIPFRQE